MGSQDDTTGGRARLLRLRGLLVKEFLQVARDPSSIAIAFVLPVILLFLFGYGVSLDAEHVPLGVVLEAPGRHATSLVSAFAYSRYFDVTGLPSMRVAGEAMQRGDVDAVLWIRSHFERSLTDRGAPCGALVIVNGVDANTARIIQGYVRGVWSLWLAGSGASAVRAGGVNPVPRIWFNAAVRSRDFLVPGLIPVIMTLIGTLLTAMIMAREWERGTMEALLATPVGTLEIIAGKTIPYFILGMGGLGISVVLARFLFDVPYRGSYLILALCSTVFMLVALGMGLLISTLARNQFVAGQVAIIATFLPAFILSGFIFDIQSMPEPIQWLTRLVAARYFVAILQTLFLAGMAPGVVWPNLAALLLMAVILFTVVMAKTRKRLD